jgi:hypothetical protein
MRDIWRDLYNELQMKDRFDKLTDIKNKILQKVAEEARREAEANRQRKNIADKAVQDALRVAEASHAPNVLAEIIVEEQGASWPYWLGAGLLAGGAVAAFFLGPETLIVSDIGSTMMAGGATEAGAMLAADIAPVAASTGLRTIVIEAAQWAEIDAAIAAEQGALAQTATSIAARKAMMAELLASVRANLPAGMEVIEGTMVAIGVATR